jgi:predicted nucleic acid-binding protein
MARPRGRRPATRGVFAIEDAALLLPPVVALDTSFVVEALIETQPLHEVCARFAAQLVEASTTVVTSELLEIELAEAAFAIALKQRWGRHWRSHRTDGRARRPARRLLDGVTTRRDALLTSVDHVSVPVGRIASGAATLMTGYGLASYDAVHAAAAIAAGAGAIVTLDTGFALLPQSFLELHTDRSRVGACRAKRPRR